jgi:formate--tetrahydrofolate ligase
VIAINRFASDTEAELAAIFEWAKQGNHPTELSEVFALGSKGGLALAKTVVRLTEGPLSPEATQLYSLDLPIETKVRIIATKLYGAKDVVFLEKAQDQMREYVHNGWDKLAICMAKTPLSLTDNPKILGRPRDFVITVREFKPSVGAGFLVALTGEVMTMPGLPKLGAYENMDVIDGKIVGLF